MKKVMFGVVVMLISLAMISCDNKRQKIKDAAEKANQECPMDMGTIGAATGITYDEDMNEMVYEYELTEEFNNVKSLSDNPEMMKRSAMMAFSSDSESLKTLADMMIEAGGSIKFVYHGLKSGATAEVSLNAEELETAMNMESTPLDVLKSNIDMTNLQMPMALAEGIQMKELRLLGDNVTYICEMDPELFDLSQIDSNREAVKESIIEQARQMGAVERTFINQVVAADKNLAYHYCYEDTPESQSVTIVISTDELMDLLE